MSKPIAYCQISGRGFSQWEMNALTYKNDVSYCSCHDLPVVEMFPHKSLSEGIHDMIADHNSIPEKKFYYSEEEVKNLLRLAFFRNKGNKIDFDSWWDNVKKK